MIHQPTRSNTMGDLRLHRDNTGDTSPSSTIGKVCHRTRDELTSRQGIHRDITPKVTRLPVLPLPTIGKVCYRTQDDIHRDITPETTRLPVLPLPTIGKVCHRTRDELISRQGIHRDITPRQHR